MSRTLVRLGLRLSLRGALIWAVVTALFLALVASAWASAYPTLESRRQIASALGNNPGFRAFAGPPRAIDTAGGFLVWRIGVTLLAMLGVWALLTSTRLLRGEEEAGRRELVLSQPVTAHCQVASALAAMGAGLTCVWLSMIAVLLAVGPRYELPAADSVLFSTGMVLGAATFAAVGAVCSELVPTRRGAAGLAGCILAASEIIRVIGDGTGAGTLRWASPLGWLSELHAYSGARPPVLGLWAAAALALVATTLRLAGRRDLGASVLRARDRSPARTRLLRSPLPAAVRFARGTALAWIAGMSVYGFVVGAISSSVVNTIGRSGAPDFLQSLVDIATVRGYLAFAEFFLLAMVVSVVAASSISSHWEEERSGRAETVLACAVGRARWLGSRTVVSACTFACVAAGSSISCWLGVIATHGSVSMTQLLTAGLSTIPVAAVFLGIGSLAYGVSPRSSVSAAYACIVMSFLIQIVGTLARWPAWVLDLSPFHHLGAAPLLPFNAGASVVLTAVGLACVAAGHAAFARRDLRAG